MKLLLLSVFVGRALCFSNAQLASSKPPVGCVRPWVSFERGVLFAGLKRFKMIDAARNSIQCHESVSSERDPMQRFDSTAVIKYSIALITQVSLFTVSFCSLDKVVSAIGVIKVPWILNFFFLCNSFEISSVESLGQQSTESPILGSRGRASAETRIANVDSSRACVSDYVASHYWTAARGFLNPRVPGHSILCQSSNSCVNFSSISRRHLEYYQQC